MKWISVIMLTLCIGCTPSTETENPKVSVQNKSQKASKPSLEEIKKATNVPEMPQKDEGDGGEDPLRNPSLANTKAPAEFTVLLDTTKGDVLLEIHRDWAPIGVDRFYNLVKVGYFTDLAFFRVIGGFMAQFGMHGDPTINSSWKRSTIQDDPVRESNRRGYLTFAKTNSPNSRSTQLFINYGNNKNLDSMQFAPIGQVVDEPGRGGGMSIIDQLYSEYGEGAPRGRGPSQSLMGRKGNTYLKSEYPNLDYIKSARVCGENSTPENTKAYCP